MIASAEKAVIFCALLCCQYKNTDDYGKRTKFDSHSSKPCGNQAIISANQALKDLLCEDDETRKSTMIRLTRIFRDYFFESSQSEENQCSVSTDIDNEHMCDDLETLVKRSIHVVRIYRKLEAPTDDHRPRNQRNELQQIPDEDDASEFSAENISQTIYNLERILSKWCEKLPLSQTFELDNSRKTLNREKSMLQRAVEVRSAFDWPQGDFQDLKRRRASLQVTLNMYQNAWKAVQELYPEPTILEELRHELTQSSCPEKSDIVDNPVLPLSEKDPIDYDNIEQYYQSIADLQGQMDQTLEILKDTEAANQQIMSAPSLPPPPNKPSGDLFKNLERLQSSLSSKVSDLSPLPPSPLLSAQRSSSEDELPQRSNHHSNRQTRNESPDLNETARPVKRRKESIVPAGKLDRNGTSLQSSHQAGAQQESATHQSSKYLPKGTSQTGSRRDFKFSDDHDHTEETLPLKTSSSTQQSAAPQLPQKSKSTVGPPKDISNEHLPSHESTVDPSLQKFREARVQRRQALDNEIKSRGTSNPSAIDRDTRRSARLSSTGNERRRSSDSGNNDSETNNNTDPHSLSTANSEDFEKFLPEYLKISQGGGQKMMSSTPKADFIAATRKQVKFKSPEQAPDADETILAAREPAQFGNPTSTPANINTTENSVDMAKIAKGPSLDMDSVDDLMAVPQPEAFDDTLQI